MKKIIMYTTLTCSDCRSAKAFFKERGLDYIEYDVSTDPVKREEMLEIAGKMSVPTIVVDGVVDVGFDRERVESILRSQGL